MRWIALLLLPTALLLLAAACEEEDDGEPTPTATVAVEPTDTLPPPPEPTATPVPPEPTEPSQACHPSYEGACLNPNASDYDCAGGSGNGPLYTGPVRVVGPDVFDLDRDNDGIGCE